ncbi:MAG: sulfotransferase [Sulfitobacter sp.]
MLYVKTILKSLIGTRVARRQRIQTRALVKAPLYGLAALAKRTPPAASDDSPIFIFSAGWRSGSTLLQRLLCSNHATLIWGEPYDLCGIIQTLSRLPRPVTQDWPPEEYFISEHDPDNLTASWIANLYPSLPDFREALKAMLCRMFSDPANARGAERWGLKEVRFGLEEAVFLQWLFPNAKFLMIHRDVEDAFRSYQSFSPSMNWYATWPSRPAFTPFAFARHRQRLLKQFPEIARQTGGLIISYEELTQGTADLNEIAQYCGVDIDPSILKTRVQGRKKTKILAGGRLSWVDRTFLRAGAAYENNKSVAVNSQEISR